MLKTEHVSHLAGDLTIGTGKRNKRRLEVGRDIPTTDEMRRLIGAASFKLKFSTLLKVAALTGLRASELRGLRWADVDLKANELHIRQRADRWNRIGPPKSDSGTRKIPFGADLALALKGWKLACPKGGLDLVFPTFEGTVIGYKHFTNRRSRYSRPHMWWTNTASQNMRPMRSATSSQAGASTQRLVVGASYRPRWCKSGWAIVRSKLRSTSTATCFHTTAIAPRSTRPRRHYWAERDTDATYGQILQ